MATSSWGKYDEGNHMIFIKTVHHRVPGHAHTMKQGELLTTRVLDRFWDRFDHDEDEDEKEDKATKQKKKKAWRSTFQNLKETFVHGTPEEALEQATTIYDDEDLPEEIATALEPLLQKLQEKRPDIVSYLFTQIDPSFDVLMVEDGHERVPSDPDNPKCTIVWRNGLWRWVEGSAQEVVNEMLKGAKPLKK